jgi:hypothetical protein
MLNRFNSSRSSGIFALGFPIFAADGSTVAWVADHPS